jgi:hypothetical protein
MYSNTSEVYLDARWRMMMEDGNRNMINVMYATL